MSVLFLETQGLRWLGGGGCARGLIRRRLLPDVCSCCVSRSASVRMARRGLIVRPAHHLLSFKLLRVSDILKNVVMYKTIFVINIIIHMCLQHSNTLSFQKL